MKVKALKDGFCDSRRKAGAVFNIDPRQFRGWMQKLEDPADKPKPEKKTITLKKAEPSDLI
jgi:hypothetical protein